MHNKPTRCLHAHPRLLQGCGRAPTLAEDVSAVTAGLAGIVLRTTQRQSQQTEARKLQQARLVAVSGTPRALSAIASLLLSCVYVSRFQACVDAPTACPARACLVACCDTQQQCNSQRGGSPHAPCCAEPTPHASPAVSTLPRNDCRGTAGPSTTARCRLLALAQGHGQPPTRPQTPTAAATRCRAAWRALRRRLTPPLCASTGAFWLVRAWQVLGSGTSPWWRTSLG